MQNCNALFHAEVRWTHCYSPNLKKQQYFRRQSDSRNWRRQRERTSSFPSIDKQLGQVADEEATDDTTEVMHASSVFECRRHRRNLEDWSTLNTEVKILECAHLHIYLGACGRHDSIYWLKVVSSSSSHQFHYRPLRPQLWHPYFLPILLRIVFSA